MSSAVEPLQAVDRVHEHRKWDEQDGFLSEVGWSAPLPIHLIPNETLVIQDVKIQSDLAYITTNPVKLQRKDSFC